MRGREGGSNDLLELPITRSMRLPRSYISIAEGQEKESMG